MLAQLIRNTALAKRRQKGSSTVIFADVDGVLVPEGSNGRSPATPDEWARFDVPFQRDCFYRPDVLNRLRKATADHKVWLSSWQEKAHDSFGPIVGDWEVLSPDEQEYEWNHPGDTDWWKANLLLEWVDQNPQVTHVVWCEDELNHVDRLEAARTVYDELRGLGLRVMVVCPDPKRGLTDYHLDLIDGFAKG